jgi:hypothetical protein
VGFIAISPEINSTDRVWNPVSALLFFNVQFVGDELQDADEPRNGGIVGYGGDDTYDDFVEADGRNGYQVQKIRRDGFEVHCCAEILSIESEKKSKNVST